jgi:hypothetical protein
MRTLSTSRATAGMIAVLALLSTAATCNHGTPRHDTKINLQALTAAVDGLQRGETALFTAGTLPALTLDRHKAFNAKLVEIVDAVDAARAVVLAWRPGQPIPAQLGTILQTVKVLLKTSTEVMGGALPKEFTDVWDAVTTITLAIGGAL